jgi:hypothetical protein
VSLDLQSLFVGGRNEEKVTMFTEVINKLAANHKATKRYHLLAFFFTLIFASAIYPAKANAQIVGDIEATIPFQFHAGNTKFPAGEYRIHVMDNTDLSVMEITSMDGTVSALFQVRDTDASSEPTKTELIFNRYGNRYFLAKLFDVGETAGSQVVESGYEKKISQATLEGQEHVPARHRTQQGK